MKVSFVATIYNEEDSIASLLESIGKQSKMPDEVIIVDGGSTDKTLEIIQRSKFKVIQMPGNRSVGRNEGIKQATGDIIAVSDAGCVLDEDWLKNITQPFGTSTLKESRSLPRHLPGEVDVVAGYYKGLHENVLQKALIPYVLVMANKVNKKTFLPATRSMAFTKKIWEKVCGFDEEYSYNEDYVFARKLKAAGANIVFIKEAFVYWVPRKNLKEAFIMFYKFAYGDAQAGIFRPKVILLFIRYAIGILLFLYFMIASAYVVRDIIVILLLLYLVWAIVKNYSYVQNLRALYILPILQITADIAVLSGSSRGLLKKYGI